MRVIPVSSILSVVGMIPHPKNTPIDTSHIQNDYFYVAEKLGLDICILQGVDNFEDEEDKEGL